MNKLYTIFLLLLSYHLNSQVALITIDQNENKHEVLIGPENIDGYYPNQATVYIKKYEKLLDEQLTLLKNLETELNNLKNKKFRNTRRIDQINFDIENLYINIEQLENFSVLWTNHSNKFTKFYDQFNSIYDDSSYFEIQFNGNTLNHDEFEIKKLNLEQEILFYEFIKNGFERTIIEVPEEEFQLSLEENKPIRITPKNIIIDSSSISKLIERYIFTKNHHYDGSLTVDHPIVIKYLEDMFIDFTFDYDNLELYKSVEIKISNNFYQIILKDGRQIIPEKINKNNGK